jgi:1,4-dihydroxy-6-naphthoate synthase
MTQVIRLGISTCPNDTFAFHALMNKLVDWRGLEFEIDLLDIQELNERIDQGVYHVAKASFHAALRWTRRMVVLPSGSALGFGVGPLLLAAKPNTVPSSSSQLTLCPGKDTTAALLFQMFYPGSTRIEHVVFSEIMPYLQSSRADFGVCIHEGRFTWQAAGLSLVEDLGVRWESETHCPLPLGGILAARELGAEVLRRVQSTIRDSLTLALQGKTDPLPTMRTYAQEFDDTVLMKHVELYVNDWTVDLGKIGQESLNQFSLRAKAIGAIPNDQPGLEVWQA